jgi:tryptophan-rich sensory protein
MLKAKRLPFFIILIFILNGLIFFRAFYTIEGIEEVFAECARNSGRTSAAINLLVLIMLGLFGLKRIYHKNSLKDAFRVLITLFAINHLIHFVLVSFLFNSHSWELGIVEHLHGFITYICIVLLPIILWISKKLSKLLYLGIILHIINVTYMISHTFYSRYNEEDPAHLHRTGIVIMCILVLYMIYRVFKERSIKFEIDKHS